MAAIDVTGGEQRFGRATLQLELLCFVRGDGRREEGLRRLGAASRMRERAAERDAQRARALVVVGAELQRISIEERRAIEGERTLRNRR